MPLTRLMYFSENQISSAEGSTVRALNSILSASNRNNKSANLTGALIFDDLWFIQALEGERESVWRTFLRIYDDDRHANVMLAECIAIEERTFGNWWMGLTARERETDHAFLPFLHRGKLDPRRMTASEMLLLMVGVSRLGLLRELATPQAA